MSISCHILDTTQGKPAADVDVRLRQGDEMVALAYGRTDADGRVKVWKSVKGDTVEVATQAGAYTLVFSTGPYFEAQGIQEPFFPAVEVSFNAKAGQKYHIPLLLSPYSYSTYRGS